MKKLADYNQARLALQTIKSKAERQLEVEAAFGSDVRAMQKMDQQLLGHLFHQAVASQGTSPQLSKTASIRRGIVGAVERQGGLRGIARKGVELLRGGEPVNGVRAGNSLPILKDTFQEIGRAATERRNPDFYPENMQALASSAARLGVAGTALTARSAYKAQKKQKQKMEDRETLEALAATKKVAHVAPRTFAFFEKQAGLTEAQKHFPELLKVAQKR